MSETSTTALGTALVTGASSGIGYELTKLLAADGHDVVLVSRREETLAAVASELEFEYGVDGHVMPADLSKPDAARDLYERVTDAGIDIDILVNRCCRGCGLPRTRGRR